MKVPETAIKKHELRQHAPLPATQVEHGQKLPVALRRLAQTGCCQGQLLGEASLCMEEVLGGCTCVSTLRSSD